jgi:hypothetical protein
VNPVLLHGSREDKDVVDVNKHGAVQHVPEDIVDQGLEDSGALVSPKGITRYSKWPKGVLKAVFHSSPSRMRTKWYALRRSSLVKTTAPWRGTKAELTRGLGRPQTLGQAVCTPGHYKTCSPIDLRVVGLKPRVTQNDRGEGAVNHQKRDGLVVVP